MKAQLLPLIFARFISIVTPFTSDFGLEFFLGIRNFQRPNLTVLILVFFENCLKLIMIIVVQEHALEDAKKEPSAQL